MRLEVRGEKGSDSLVAEGWVSVETRLIRSGNAHTITSKVHLVNAWKANRDHMSHKHMHTQTHKCDEYLFGWLNIKATDETEMDEKVKWEL